MQRTSWERTAMINVLVFAAAACLSCRDTEAPTGLRLGVPDPSIDFQEAEGCVKFELTFVAGSAPTSQSVYTPNWPCPSGELRVLTDTAVVFDSATGALRVGVVLENVGTLPIIGPVRLSDFPNAIERYNAQGAWVPSAGLPPILGYQADSTGAGGRSWWTFSDLLAAPGQPQVLMPGARTLRRWVEFRGTSWAYRTRLKVWALGKELVSEVPPVAPVTFPRAIVDSLPSLESTPGERFKAQLLVVEFRSGTAHAERERVIHQMGAYVIGGWASRIGGEGAYLLRVPSATTAIQLLRLTNQLLNEPVIAMGGVYHTQFPDDASWLKPNDGANWGRDSWRVSPDLAEGANTALERISAPLAWGCSTGASSTKLGLTDSGMYAIPDLANNIAGDIVEPVKLFDHGTQVASVAVAEGNNGALVPGGMTGVMWAASMYMRGWTYDADTLNFRPRWLVQRDNLVALGDSGASVILMARNYGWNGVAPTPGDTATATQIRLAEVSVTEAIKTLRARTPARRPLFVLSAGNEGFDARLGGFVGAKDVYPNQVMVVGGLANSISSPGQAIQMSLPDPTTGQHTNRGPLVDIYAPGENVGVLTQNSTVTLKSGTSFAMPLAAGVAGLVKSFDPTIPDTALKAIVLAGASASVMTDVGLRPVLDAYGALRKAAERLSAPLCGNRVWFSGSSIKIQRGAQVQTVPITVPSGHLAHSLEVQHGGKRIAYGLTDTVGTFQDVPLPRSVALVNGTWVTGPNTVLSPDSAGGTARSIIGRSHNGDTTLVARVSADASWNVTLDLQVQVNGQTIKSRQRSLPPIPVPGPNVHPSETWFTAGAYPMVGQDAFVAVNHIRHQVPSVLEVASVPLRATIFKVHLDDPALQIDSLGTIPDSAVYDIALSEDGSEKLVRIGRDSLYSNLFGFAWVGQGCRLTWSRAGFGSTAATFLFDSLAARRTESSTGCESSRGEMWLGRGTNAPRVAPKRPVIVAPTRASGAGGSGR